MSKLRMVVIKNAIEQLDAEGCPETLINWAIDHLERVEESTLNGILVRQVIK